MKTIVDPPSGWQYGFPKEYTPKHGQEFESWLLEQGYPPELLDLAAKHSRFWNVDDENTACNPSTNR